MDVFSLPEYIRVMVSNYQLLQTTFSIAESECHTRKVRPDEQFSPIVTVVNTATQNILNCILLLCGEKPPEVSCRTLFCYIAVEVTAVPGNDVHPHTLYHMESKSCTQGKLLLMFSFHQPGTVCIIHLSIHSIADSAGVEYVYNSEDYVCIVQIIDRNQQGGTESRAQHGVVRMKEPPLLRYTGPLATKQYHKLSMLFKKFYLSSNHMQIQQLSKQIFAESSISDDIKVYALCWEALSQAILKNYVPESYEELLKTAWKKASKLECENGLLLQGRVLRFLAHMQYSQGKDKKDYISQAKERFCNAAPSNETAFALHTELRMKRHILFSKHIFSLELYTSIEKDYELLLKHVHYMEEHEKPVIYSFLAMKASFHLRSDLITDKFPPKEYWPSPDDLRKAEECLKKLSLDTMPDQSNFYTGRYFCAVCDLYIWKQQYPEAMHHLEKAQIVYDQMKLKSELHKLDPRLKLLEGLTKIDEVLKDYDIL